MMQMVSKSYIDSLHQDNAPTQIQWLDDEHNELNIKPAPRVLIKVENFFGIVRSAKGLPLIVSHILEAQHENFFNP